MANLLRSFADIITTQGIKHNEGEATRLLSLAIINGKHYLESCLLFLFHQTCFIRPDGKKKKKKKQTGTHTKVKVKKYHKSRIA